MTTDPSKCVLKNGKEVLKLLVGITITALDKLQDAFPMAFYELVCACRNPSHQLHGELGSILMDLDLIERVEPNGTARIRPDIRDIITCAVEGEDLDMELGSPLAGT